MSETFDTSALQEIDRPTGRSPQPCSPPGGVATFVLGLLTTLNKASTGIHDFLEFSKDVGAPVGQDDPRSGRLPRLLGDPPHALAPPEPGPAPDHLRRRSTDPARDPRHLPDLLPGVRLRVALGPRAPEASAATGGVRDIQARRELGCESRRRRGEKAGHPPCDTAAASQ